jgi:hypothetical protein
VSEWHLVLYLLRVIQQLGHLAHRRLLPLVLLQLLLALLFAESISWI